MGEHLFKGSALRPVDAAGRMILPGFANQTLLLRQNRGRLLIGVHEADPCLIAFDPGGLDELRSNCESRRAAEGAAAQQHHFLLRRMFGFMAEVDVSDSGRFAIPAILLSRARIKDAVLLIGTGASLELWDPQAALDSGDPDLRELAAFHLQPQRAA